jgi:hypothetical protein
MEEEDQPDDREIPLQPRKPKRPRPEPPRTVMVQIVLLAVDGTKFPLGGARPMVCAHFPSISI